MQDILKPLLHPEISYQAYTVDRGQTPLVVIDSFIKNRKINQP
jgi:hypothetical protein